ncbi:hypothetical protein Drorol1_Dr00023765, partial [Drosera rotundifolia]
IPSGLPLLISLIVKVRSGRSKKERRRATNEPRRNIIRASRQGAIVNCGKCKQPGHNARTCTDGNASRFTQSQLNPISEPPLNEGSANNIGPSVQNHNQLPRSSNASIPMSFNPILKAGQEGHQSLHE